MFPLPLFFHQWFAGKAGSRPKQVFTLLVAIIVGYFYVSNNDYSLMRVISGNSALYILFGIAFLHLWNVIECCSSILTNSSYLTQIPLPEKSESNLAKTVLIRVLGLTSYIATWFGIFTSVFAHISISQSFDAIYVFTTRIFDQIYYWLVNVLSLNTMTIIVFVFKLAMLSGLVVSIIAYFAVAYNYWRNDKSMPLKHRLFLCSNCFPILGQTLQKLYDGKNYGGLSVLSHKFGQMQVSWWLSLLLRIPYLFVWLLARVELLSRVTIGFIIVTLLSGIWYIISIVSTIIAIAANLLDPVLRHKISCPNCKLQSKLPVYICPKCRTEHKRLLPGEFGILFARCSCGEKLPCSVLRGRPNLRAKCPLCGSALASGGIPRFSIQLVGSSDEGKNAYLAAFWHQYLSTVSCGFRLEPLSKFSVLEKDFRNGTTHSVANRNAVAYSVVHKQDGNDVYELSIYDLSSDALKEELYDIQQRQFAYCDAIVVEIDHVDLYESVDNSSFVEYANDEIDDAIEGFINKYSDIRGLHAGKRSDIPVAVVINGVGNERLDVEFNKENIESVADKQFESNSEKARDELCKDYLNSIGLTSAILELEAKFTTIHYFPISIIGHSFEAGNEYKPQGVIETINWLFPERIKQLSNGTVSFSHADNTKKLDELFHLDSDFKKKMADEIKTSNADVSDENGSEYKLLNIEVEPDARNENKDIDSNDDYKELVGDNSEYFDVIIEASGSDTILMIKEIRAITYWALKEAKDFIEFVPERLLSGIPMEHARIMKSRFEAIGAKVQLSNASKRNEEFAAIRQRMQEHWGV